MLKLKKRIDGYLKYPLMWVMLLWAFTMPGHEVRVYNFLIRALAGKPTAVFEYAQAEVSSTEKQQQESYAYLEAAPATSFAGKIKFQPLGTESGSFYFSPGNAATFFSFTGHSFKDPARKDQLLIALLPNAP
jgi:hypothetical protein